DPIPQDRPRGRSDGRRADAGKRRPAQRLGDPSKEIKGGAGLQPCINSTLHGCRIIAGLKACSTLAAARKRLRPRHTSAPKGATPSKSTPIQVAFPVLKLKKITKSGKYSCRKSN